MNACFLMRKTVYLEMEAYLEVPLTFAAQRSVGIIIALCIIHNFFQNPYSLLTFYMQRKFEAMTSPSKTITSPLCFSPASPANGNCINNSKAVYATPVSTAMTTAKWLRSVISALPSKPSQELVHFLSSCDRDLTGDVVRRAEIILEAVFPSKSFGERCIAGSLQSASLMDGIWAEQRKLEAMKLYYRVLEAICRAEAQILNGNNLTSLLSNERFHRCMLACSAELVLATHKTITLMFPAVLERAGITAFDLSKVIESFVRHEETLPRELKRHLNSLEERLLESMAWEKGSSMYNSLIVARPALSAEINRLGLLAEPMPSLDAIALHLNMPTVCFPPPKKWESSTGRFFSLRYMQYSGYFFYSQLLLIAYVFVIHCHGIGKQRL